MTVSTADEDGSVVKVEYFQGLTKIGQSTSSPFSFTWTGVPEGVYSLTAKATDDDGNTTTSTAVGLTVYGLPNVAPTVAITSPAESAIFTAGENITLTVQVADSDGTVAQVDYYQGNTKIGTSSSSPFSFTWSKVPGGNYTLVAKATDDDGDTRYSNPVNIMVNNPPSARDDAASTVENATVEINVLANDSDLDGDPISLVDVGTPSHGLSLIANKRVRYTPNPGYFGTDQFTYSVQDARGTVSVGKVVVTVKPILDPPTIQITSPADGTVYLVGQDVPFTVNTGVKSGTVTKVEYFQGITSIGLTTASPFGLTWSKPQAGTYRITAKVTDSNGATVTSSPIGIVVNTLPVAKDDISTTAKGTSTDINVLANDIDADNNPLTIDSVVQPAHGSAEIVANKIRYTPNASFFGEDRINYTVKDIHGGKASASVTVNVTVAAKMFTIQITAPQSGTQLTTGSDVTIKAEIPDTNVAVNKVDFYAGNTLLGTATASPYQYQWRNVPAGNYSLTVKALDKDGRLSTSSSVSLKVQAQSDGNSDGDDGSDDGDGNDNTELNNVPAFGICSFPATILLMTILASFLMIAARQSWDEFDR